MAKNVKLIQEENTMTKLDRINEMEKQLAQLKAGLESEQNVEPEGVKQWEPVGGDWTVFSDGSVSEVETDECYRVFGTERPTETQAIKASDEMRMFNRLLAYRDEHDPDFVEVWDGDTANYYVKWLQYSGKYQADSWYTCKQLGTVFMSKPVAEELARKLNSGEVVL